MVKQAADVVNKIDSLPPDEQALLAKYLSDHFNDLLDQARWEQLFPIRPPRLDRFAAEVDEAIRRGTSGQSLIRTSCEIVPDPQVQRVIRRTSAVTFSTPFEKLIGFGSPILGIHHFTLSRFARISGACASP